MDCQRDSCSHAAAVRLLVEFQSSRSLVELLCPVHAVRTAIHWALAYPVRRIVPTALEPEAAESRPAA